jgi:hypothetical protein
MARLGGRESRLAASGYGGEADDLPHAPRSGSDPKPTLDPDCGAASRAFFHHRWLSWLKAARTGSLEILMSPE